MVAKIKFITCIIPVIFLSGCGILVKTSKYQLSDGYYIAKSPETKYSRVYVDNNTDTITSYNIKKYQKRTIVDSTKQSLIFSEKIDKPLSPILFIQPSFDVDVLTILFKYRPETEGFPNQINASFNGVIYLGFRNDLYHLKYKQTPLKFNRNINHYGFSFGGFAGFGSTVMNPSVTKNFINIEYDGVAFTKGFAAIVAVANLSIGITVGFDNIIDKNSGFWIYENKPWVGLALGLNLN